MTANLHALTPREPTPLRAELAAMREIAEAIDTLPDNQSRDRVLRWAMEFFDLKDGGRPAAAPMSHAPQPKMTAKNDPHLAVNDLSSFFEDDPVDPDQMAISAPAAEAGVRSMLHNFVADFQKLARDWQD